MENQVQERENNTIPFYSRIAQIFVGLLAFFFIMVIGQEIIVPIIFAGIFAILLNPAVNWLARKGVNRVVAIVISLALSTLVMLSIFYFIGSRMSMFGEAFPELQRKFTELARDTVAWLSTKFDLSTTQINKWVESKMQVGLEALGSRLGNTLLSLSGALVFLFLVPVYIFLILYYKPLLLEFLSRVFPKNKKRTVNEVLHTSKSMIQSYLGGLFIQMLIIATLNSTAWLIIGVDYAIVFGVIGAMLNLIPYIGGLIAMTLPMIMAFISGSPISALYVLIAYAIIQAIDNNLIVPLVVASKVKINALVSVIAVIVGGSLWGISGMFLSLPLTAILKVVLDNVEELKPYGYLLGDDMPPEKKIKFKFPWPRKKTATAK